MPASRRLLVAALIASANCDRVWPAADDPAPASTSTPATAVAPAPAPAPADPTAAAPSIAPTTGAPSRDRERVLAAEVAVERGQPALAAALLREVAAPSPWSDVPGWAGMAVKLRGAQVRQRHRLDHTGPLVGFAATPDGMHVAGVADGGKIRVWSLVGDVVKVRDLVGATGRFSDIAISPDGARVVAGGGGIGKFGKDAPVWLWAGDTLVGELAGHTDAVLEMAFRPDGKAIATAGMDGTARVWDAATGASLAEFAVVAPDDPDAPPGLRGPMSVGPIVWRPDGQRLATGDNKGVIHEWTVGRAAATTTLRGHTEDIEALAYSPDGTRLVSGSSDDTARVWRTATGALEHTFKFRNTVSDVAFHPNGTWIAAMAYAGDVRVINLENGYEQKLDGSRWPIALSYSPDGAYLATADKDYGLLWRGHGAAGLAPLRGHTGEVFDVRFTAGGQLLTAGRDGSVRVWQIDRGARTPAPKRDYAFAYSPNGPRRLLAGLRDDEATREMDGERTLWSMPLGEVEAAVYADDGATLALATRTRELLIVRSGTGELVRRWSDERTFKSLALRSDGNLAAAGLFDVAVWGPDGRQRVALRSDIDDYAHHEYAAVAWHPDGTRLALTTGAHALLLWRLDAPAPDVRVDLEGEFDDFDRLVGIAWSGDGARVAVAETGGRVFEYDVASLRPLGRWTTAPVDNTDGLRYAPDGARLLVVDIAGEQHTFPSVRDPADILAALWQTDRACPSLADRQRWQHLDEATAAADLARCERLLACVVAGTPPATCPAP